ncbi:hypothetical protein GCM10010350_42150 [Streptomyces galilaeus]|nr:hypothetical protein GCM10010350_42150 [Streptomyces galilaeus]
MPGSPAEATQNAAATAVIRPVAVRTTASRSAVAHPLRRPITRPLALARGPCPDPAVGHPALPTLRAPTHPARTSETDAFDPWRLPLAGSGILRNTKPRPR